jgi:uncharacterized protein with HEPN domain
MLEACERIQRYTERMDLLEFASDGMRQDAVVRNLEVIGEAARQLPEEIRDTLSTVPWHQVIGMRNLLIHAYFGVDPEIVWSVITEKLPPLVNAVQAYLSDHGS